MFFENIRWNMRTGANLILLKSSFPCMDPALEASERTSFYGFKYFWSLETSENHRQKPIVKGCEWCVCVCVSVSVSVCFGHCFWMFDSTLPETNSSPLKVDPWKRRFLFGTTIFMGENASFREGRDIFGFLCWWLRHFDPPSSYNSQWTLRQYRGETRGLKESFRWGGSGFRPVEFGWVW